MEVIRSVQELKREMNKAVSYAEDYDFPVTYLYNKGIESPQFKITIEMLESDTFVDSNGHVWKRQRENDEEE